MKGLYRELVLERRRTDELEARIEELEAERRERRRAKLALIVAMVGLGLYLGKFLGA